MITEGKHEVNIEGIVNEIKVRDGEYTNAQGKKVAYKAGEIVIKVAQDYRGVTFESDIPVRFFVGKYSSKGQEIASYGRLCEFLDSAVSLASGATPDQATHVRTNLASLKENNFIGRDGKVVSYAEINSSFFNAVPAARSVDQATFSQVIVVGNIKQEVDRDGVETGRVIVTGIVPQYGGKVDVIEFVSGSEQAAEYIFKHWEQGDTVKISGLINYSTKTYWTEEEVGFGDPIRKPHTTSVKELLIYSGSPGNIENAYDQEEIQQALEDRKNRLAALPAPRPKAPLPTNRPSVNFNDMGF